MNKKASRYKRVYEQLGELARKCDDPIARMATISAVLHHKMDGFFWTGFYLLKQGKLIVGPYQGPVACQELAKDKGVCWACVNQQNSLVVPDVEEFPGHIACDSRSRSEITVPVFDATHQIVAVLDIDSKSLDWFDETDKEWLENICALVYSR